MPDGFRDEKAPVLCARSVFLMCEALKALEDLKSTDEDFQQASPRARDTFRGGMEILVSALGQTLSSAQSECLPEFGDVDIRQLRVATQKSLPTEIKAAVAEVSSHINIALGEALKRVT